MPLKKKSFTIKDWDVSDRPREKLKSQGASYLSNAELFAVLIGSGSSSESAVGLMKRILLSINNDLQKFDQLAHRASCGDLKEQARPKLIKTESGSRVVKAISKTHSQIN